MGASTDQRVLRLPNRRCALAIKKYLFRSMNAEEAALVKGITVYGAATFKEVIDHVQNPYRDRKGNQLEVGTYKNFPQKLTDDNSEKYGSQHRLFRY